MSSLARASSVMAAGTAVSRVLGLVKAAVLAAAVGLVLTSGNAFALANSVPNSIYVIVAGGVLNAILVPQVVRAIARDTSGRRGADYVDRLVTVAVLVLGGVTLLAVLAAPVIVSLYGGALVGAPLTGAQRGLAVAFAYWCLPQIFFYALYALLGQILNAHGSFGPYMWAPVVNNVVALAGLGVFLAVYGGWAGGGPGAGLGWSAGQVALLAGSATAGVALQALVLVVPLRRLGIRIRPRFGLRGMGLRSAGRAAGWTVGGVLLGQVGFVVVSTIASAISAQTPRGDVSTPGLNAWNYAYLVFALPHSLIAVSIVTALFTSLSTSAAAGRTREVVASFSLGLRTVGTFNVLALAGIAVLPVPLIVLVSGAPDQSRAVAPVLVAMSAGLVAFSALSLMQRVFYAYEDARTPFLLNCVSVGLWLAGSLLSLALPLGDRLVGVGAAMSVGVLVSAVVGVVLVRRRLGAVDGTAVLRTHVRLVVAGVVAATVGAAVAAALGGAQVAGRADAALVLAVAGGSMTLVYAAVLVVLRVREVAPLVTRIPGVPRSVSRRLAAPASR